MKTLKNLSTLALAAVALGACSKSASKTTTGPDTTKTDTTTHNPPPPPDNAQVLVLAGNIAKCSNGNSALTARLIDSLPTATVIALGNNANPSGTLATYNNCYQPTWGNFLNRTYAALGEHDYDSSGSALGAFQYFGTKAGPVNKGYYSFDIGAWHVIVLNSNNQYVPYTTTSEPTAWLLQDLAATKQACIMAVWHDPRWYSSASGAAERMTLTNTWNRLYAGGVRLIVNGGAYQYERMNPLMPDGTGSDSGIVQINAGLGGESTQAIPTGTGVVPASAALSEDYGVLKLTLHSDHYDWQYLTVPGSSSFTDAGSRPCR